MKMLVSLVTAALIGTAPAAFAQTGTETAPPATNLPAAPANEVETPDFIAQATASNAFEIRSSALAIRKASSEDVRAFASKMVEDHTQAAADLDAALARPETTASTDPDDTPLPQRYQALLDELDGLEGEAFEARYVALQLVAHQEAVALFTAYANSGDDPALKEFAKKTLETLTMHERQAKELAAAQRG